MANEQPSNEVELTAGEKEQLQDVVSTNNRTAQLASGIYMRKIQLEKDEAVFKQQVDASNAKSNELGGKLQEKYGQGQVDLERGVFIKS